MFKNAIGAVPIHFNNAVQDCVVWQGNLTGIYTTNSGYKWLLQRSGIGGQNPSLNWIWNVQAPQNLKFFFWLIAHNSISTLQMLHQRGMATSSICLRCMQGEETILHCT